jgi:hypothetical protein
MLVQCELKTIQKEAFVAYFNLLFPNVHIKAEENHGNTFRTDSVSALGSFYAGML